MSRKWTPEEDAVIIKEVSASPESIQAACRSAAETLGRTPGAVSNRWYTKISLENNPNSLCFVSMTKSKKIGKNRKNTFSNIPKREASFWKRLINSIFK